MQAAGGGPREYVDPWSAVISISRQCHCLHFEKRPSALLIAGCLSALLFIGWSPSFGDTAAALGGGCSYSLHSGGFPDWRRNLLWPSIPDLVFRGRADYDSHHPSPLTGRGLTDDGDKLFLCPVGLVSMPGRKLSSSSAFACGSYGQTMTLYSMLMCPY